MDHFHIRLEAKNPDKSHMRAYSIDAAPDLFGHWMVDISYGRIGTAGRKISYSASHESEARRLVRQCLHRRSTAPKRIGVPYQIREYSDPHQWATVSL